MVKSMTGYGSVKQEGAGMAVNVEVKAVNGRSLDVSIRLPRIFSGKEPDVKSLTGRILSRGNIFVAITTEFPDAGRSHRKIDIELMKSYYFELQQLKRELNLASDENLLASLLSLPDVMHSAEEPASEDQWEFIMQVLEEALESTDTFRIQEGNALKEEMMAYLENIEKLSGVINNMKEQRLPAIKEKLQKHISELAREIDLDQNRLEQEMVYYAEKLDITEEMVRLQSHINFFRETLAQKETGKKLNFIVQEMGREINTIGSKANHAEIQHHVVEMKDELEKIREQVQNIL
ncbi:MAG: YicC/YloC family endoribonuclease [Bacteroidia bacterium]